MKKPSATAAAMISRILAGEKDQLIAEAEAAVGEEFAKQEALRQAAREQGARYEVAVNELKKAYPYGRDFDNEIYHYAQILARTMPDTPGAPEAFKTTLALESLAARVLRGEHTQVLNDAKDASNAELFPETYANWRSAIESVQQVLGADSAEYQDIERYARIKARNDKNTPDGWMVFEREAATNYMLHALQFLQRDKKQQLMLDVRDTLTQEAALQTRLR